MPLQPWGRGGMGRAPSSKRRATGPLHVSTGPCSLLFWLDLVISGSMSPSSSRLWPHLTVQSTDLLLVGRGQEEAAHLPLQWLLHLHINVIARCLLLVRRVHAAGEVQPLGSCTTRHWPPAEAKGPWGRCSGEGGETGGRKREGG